MQKALSIMNERFGCDQCIALATTDGKVPSVRTVNSVYRNGAFYVITYAKSNKMKQIAANPHVAISGDWFTAHGIGENLGHILKPENTELANMLRTAFSAWYGNGHTNEADENTIILKILLTDGILLADGTRYEIDFSKAF